MTKREFFVKVSAGEMTEEIQAFAAEALAKMDAQLEARKGKVSEKEQAKRDANEALARRVAAEILGAEGKTATDIAVEMNEKMPEMLEKLATPQKGNSVAQLCVKLGLASKTEVKIPRKGTQNAYTAVVAE